jgi:hypothetical protein
MDFVILYGSTEQKINEITLNSDKNNSSYCSDNGFWPGFQKQDLLKIWFKVYHYILIIKRM